MEDAPDPSLMDKKCWRFCAVIEVMSEARETLSIHEENVVTRAREARDRPEDGGDGRRSEALDRTREVADDFQTWLDEQAQEIDRLTMDAVRHCPGPLALRQTVENDAYVTYVCQSSLARQARTPGERLPTITLINPDESDL